MLTNYNGHSAKSGIYQIRNLNNGRVYVGSAKLFSARQYKHVTTLRKGTHHNKFLQNDFNKCGEDSFIFEVLELVEGEQPQRLLAEQKFLDVYYDNQDSCYNFMKKTSAEGRSCFSKTPEETKKLISENSKAMWSNPEWKAARIATSRTEEFRKKQSNNQKIISANSEYRNSSEAHRKRNTDPEYKLKHSNALKSAWNKDNGTRKAKASESAKKVYQANKDLLSQALIASVSKEYALISPSGEIFLFKNLAKFCRDNNIPYNGAIYGLFKNKEKSHHGWKAG